MYVRLGLANPKEGMTEDALNYFKDVAIPLYDQVSGILSVGACINNEGQLMAWTMWANNEAKEAAMAEFQQNLSGLADFITEPPTILEGPMIAAQQYITVPKDGGDSFFARFVMGGGMQDGKTYDDAADFMKSTVYPAYENVEGIFASAACKVDDDIGFSFNFWPQLLPNYLTQCRKEWPTNLEQHVWGGGTGSTEKVVLLVQTLIKKCF